MRFSVRRGVVVCACLASLFVCASAQAAATPRVLILGPSAQNGVSSWEAQKAAAQGFAVDVVTAAQWSAMSTAQFAAYRAIIIADNHGSSDPADISAAENNTSTWGPAVNGNIIVSAADPEFHATDGLTLNVRLHAQSYIDRAIAFAASNPGRTGFYFAGQYYPGTNTPMKALDGLVPAGFADTAKNLDTIHIDPATKPAVPGLTDAILSNWNQTAHEYFTKWPSNFRVWAVGVKSPGTYTTSDAVKGYPNFLVSERVPPVSSTTGAGCTTTGTVVFTLTDNAGGSGAKAIHYTLDGAPEKLLAATGDPGHATLTVPKGRHTLVYWGEDQLGNLEAHHTQKLLVDDHSGPRLKIKSNQHKKIYRVGEIASVKIKARDDLGLKRNPSKNHKHLKTGKVGHFKVKATAIDLCGNKTTRTFRYQVI